MVNINETRQNLFTWKENAKRYCSEGKYEEAALQLRFIEEAVVNALYEKNVKGKADKSFNKIQELKEGGYINRKAENSLHSLRMLGNAAAHAENKDIFRQMETNEAVYLEDADTLINIFCDAFFAKDKAVIKAFKEFIGNYYPGKINCEIKNDSSGKCEIAGKYSLNMWFPEYITKFHPIECDITFEEEDYSGKVVDAEIRYDKLILLSYCDGAAFGLWGMISPCKKALCQLYIEKDPLKDMPFDYYVKKYSRKEDTMLLMRIIDVLTYRAPFFFEMDEKSEPVYISPNGVVLPLSEEQKRVYSLRKMDEEVMILLRKFRDDCFNFSDGEEERIQYWLAFHKDPYCMKTQYFDIAGVGEIPVCMTKLMPGKAVGIGYKYVDDDEQYLLLTDKNLNVYGKYPIDINGPKIVKNHGDLSPRAISFDAEKMARDILYNDLGALEQCVERSVYALNGIEKYHVRYSKSGEEEKNSIMGVSDVAPRKTQLSLTKKKLTRYEKKQKRTRWFCNTIDTIGTLLGFGLKIVFWGFILLIVLLL